MQEVVASISCLQWVFLRAKPKAACVSLTASAWRRRRAALAYMQTWHTHTHTHPFNGPLSGTTQVSQYQKGETNLDFTEARDSEWQWHQLGHMQVCTSLHRQITTPAPHRSVFLQAGCFSCRPTNSVKALKAIYANMTSSVKLETRNTSPHCQRTEPQSYMDKKLGKDRMRSSGFFIIADRHTRNSIPFPYWGRVIICIISPTL